MPYMLRSTSRGGGGDSYSTRPDTTVLGSVTTRRQTEKACSTLWPAPRPIDYASGHPSSVPMSQFVSTKSRFNHSGGVTRSSIKHVQIRRLADLDGNLDLSHDLVVVERHHVVAAE